MHAHSPSPQMHVEQNPTKRKCLSLGMFSGGDKQREVSY